MMTTLKCEEIRILNVSGYSIYNSITYGCMAGLKQKALESNHDIRIRNIFLDLCNKSNSSNEKELDFITSVDNFDPHCILLLDDLSLIYINTIQELFDNINFYYYGFSDSLEKYNAITFKGELYINLDLSSFFRAFDNILIDKTIIVLLNDNHYNTDVSYIVGKKFISSAKSYHRTKVMIIENLFDAIQYLRSNKSNSEKNVYINCMNSMPYHSEILNNTQITKKLTEFISCDSFIIDYSYSSISQKGSITICPNYEKDGKALMSMILDTYSHNYDSSKKFKKNGSNPVIYVDKKCIAHNDIKEFKTVLLYYGGTILKVK